MASLKGLIFDMDGTLLDNMAFHKKAWYSFLQERGIHRSEYDFEDWNHGTIYEVVARLFGQALPDAQLYEIGQQKEAYYRQTFAPHIQPLPGLHRWLQQCQEAELRLGIGTMADMPNMNFTIDGLKVREYFQAIASAEDVTAGKPAPDIYLEALRKLGLDSEGVVVFEDTNSGLQAARSAGLKVVGLATTHTHQELMQWGAHLTIDDYTAISLEICQNLLLQQE